MEESHPTLDLFDFKPDSGGKKLLQPHYDAFQRSPVSETNEGSYADRDAGTGPIGSKSARCRASRVTGKQRVQELSTFDVETFDSSSTLPANRTQAVHPVETDPCIEGNQCSFSRNLPFDIFVCIHSLKW